VLSDKRGAGFIEEELFSGFFKAYGHVIGLEPLESLLKVLSRVPSA